MSRGHATDVIRGHFRKKRAESHDRASQSRTEAKSDLEDETPGKKIRHWIGSLVLLALQGSLLVTGATLVVTGALLVVTRSY